MKSEKINTIISRIDKIIIESLEYSTLWILFAVNFEICIAIKKDNIPDMIIAMRIIDRLDKVNSGRSFATATAAPVRVF